ncbi:MAG: DNA topoisomerase IB [Actinomycetota bacterium]|nr:DNA topoisomerase IB [Actinomycetota bacterium]
MARLRRVSPGSRGWTRRRAGRGFVYLDEDGIRLDVELAGRCKALVIPPAWQDVWICPVANGHIQAVGTDEAGRRQYLYHPVWREQRDKAKHDRILTVAARLPQARRTVATQLALDGMPKERALATAFRLLDLGLFRIGGETYAEAHGSFGLATITKAHTRINGTDVEFEYVAKSGLDRCVAVRDPHVRDAVDALRRRRGGGTELLAYRHDGHWRDVSSDDINTYVKDVIGGDVSAKDFRTWHGTVLAAVALGVRVDAAMSATKRKRAVRETIVSVAEQLGNTPTVARSSYVDPRVIDRFEDGVTIAPTLQRIGPRVGADRRRDKIERAVLRMLRQ